MQNNVPSFFDRPLSDLYIEVTRGCDEQNTYPPSYYKLKRKPGSTEDPTFRFEAEYDADLNMLRKEIMRSMIIDHKEGGDGNFSMSYRGVRMRVCTLKTIPHASRMTNEGEIWTCIRVFMDKAPDLDNLKFTNDHALTVLKRLVNRSGLVLISGPTGGGKSTTGLASFRYCMRTAKGTGLMAEDPCEFVMQGEFEGDPDDPSKCRAVVFQSEAKKTEDWVDIAGRALRFKPHCVYIGELRDPDAVAQVLRLAISGHLVYATIHAGTIEQAIQSILCIARASIGELATQLVADGLVAVINQKFVDGVVDMTALEIPVDAACTIRSEIRSGNLVGLRNEISNQTMKHTSKPQREIAGTASTASRNPAPKRRAPAPPPKKKGWFR